MHREPIGFAAEMMEREAVEAVRAGLEQPEIQSREDPKGTRTKPSPDSSHRQAEAGHRTPARLLFIQPGMCRVCWSVMAGVCRLPMSFRDGEATERPARQVRHVVRTAVMRLQGCPLHAVGGAPRAAATACLVRYSELNHVKKELERALQQVNGQMKQEGGAGGDETDRSLTDTNCTFSTFPDPPDNSFMRPKTAVSAHPTR